MADQSPEALPEPDHGTGHRVFHKGTAALGLDLLTAGLHQWVREYGKGEAGHDEARERLAHEVDPFPERVGAQKDRMHVFFEAFRDGFA